jgi:hypothetical protein
MSYAGGEAARTLFSNMVGSGVDGVSGELGVPQSITLEAGNMGYREAGKAHGQRYYQLGVRNQAEYQAAIVRDPNNPNKFGYTTSSRGPQGATIVDVSKYADAVEAAGFQIVGWSHTHFDSMMNFSGNDMNFANNATTIFLTNAAGRSSILTKSHLRDAARNAGYKGPSAIRNFIRDNAEDGIPGDPIP